MDIADLRREYTKGGLAFENTSPDPFAQFKHWFDQAIEAKLLEPNAMTLATADASGLPNVRTVLLKAYDSRGFVFFTNYTSRKAQELNANPKAAALFPWLPLERQIKIQGRAEKISTAESLKYFVSRPHGSQLGAWVSQQSSVISSRKLLEMKLSELKRKFTEGKVPLPDFWGGYRIVPEVFEFWQGGANRLHDRIEYRLDSAQWSRQRLAP